MLSRLVNRPLFFARLPTSRTDLLFECDKSSLLPWCLFCEGTYEPRETALLIGLLKPGDTFVDVGANWGYFTLLSSEKVGTSGRVISIEADPRNFALLERNVARNRLEQVRCLHVAAGQQPGSLTMLGFHEAQSNKGVSYVVGNSASSEGNTGRIIQSGAVTIEVPADTIDSLMAKEGVQRVDLLKMDIEGAEALALPGMKQGLANGLYRKIVLELHGNVLGEYGTDSHSLTRILHDAGYRLWSVEPDSLKPIDPSDSSSDRSEILAIAPGEPDPPAGL